MTVVLVLDHLAALLQGIPEPVVCAATRGCIILSILDPFLFFLGFIQSLLERLDLLVLAPIQLLLSALFYQAVVEVYTSNKGTGYGRNKGRKDESLLLPIRQG